MVQAILGNNWYLVKRELDRVVADFENEYGNLGIERIFAPDVEPNAISASLNSVSLFMEAKLVIVTELSSNKIEAEKLKEIVSSVTGYTHLVIVESNVDKRSSYYKSLKKLANFKELNELTEDALPAWIIKYADENNAKISLADAQYLVQRVGANQTNIERELTKLIQFNGAVTRKNIDELTELSPTGTIFNLIDTVFSGNISGALTMYDTQRSLKVEPQAILGMLIWQMHVVATCVAGGNRSAGQISADTGINSYVVGKAQTIARKMGMQKVKEFLALLRDIELTSKKQTYNLDDALKYAITRLAN